MTDAKALVALPDDRLDVMLAELRGLTKSLDFDDPTSRYFKSMRRPDGGWVKPYQCTQSLDACAEARSEIDKRGLRVMFLNALRDVVGLTAERNRAGSPLVSDFDLIDANPRQQTIALILTLTK